MEEEINNSLPPPRHYFRDVAVLALAVVVTSEHVAQQGNGRLPYTRIAWTVQVFANRAARWP